MSVQGLTAFGLADNATADAGRLTQVKIEPMPAGNLVYLTESTQQGADQSRQSKTGKPGGELHPFRCWSCPFVFITD